MEGKLEKLTGVLLTDGITDWITGGIVAIKTTEDLLKIYVPAL